MRQLSILGSTGSIGRNTLAVAAMFPDRFRVRALTAKNNVGLLADQIRRFSPDLAVVYSEADARRLEENLEPGCLTRVLFGEDGYLEAAAYPEADTVLSAMVGAAGLLPTLAAITHGKDIALANKETLVMAGDLVMAQAKAHQVSILPVDSEHSAIFQCLAGNRKQDLKKILLTASGGPFRTLPADQFAGITPEMALAHPTWAMGEKISVDSATMMNKGLEVIEARHLFDIPCDKIEVVVHPQSIVHSMVVYVDGSVIAQMGTPDMKGAIAYALSCPERLPVDLPVPDFPSIGALNFEAPDFEKFPSLSLAFSACQTGGTLPCVLNAANEAAVTAFLHKRIGFNQIPRVIAQTLEGHGGVANPALEDILEADGWARDIAEQWINRFSGKDRR